MKRKDKKKMKYDYSKLIGRIIELFGTRKAFCEAFGMAPSALSERLLNKKGFTQPEMKRMASPEFLDISLTEYGEYFFTPSCSQNENDETSTSPLA